MAKSGPGLSVGCCQLADEDPSFVSNWPKPHGPVPRLAKMFTNPWSTF